MSISGVIHYLSEYITLPCNMDEIEKNLRRVNRIIVFWVAIIVLLMAFLVNILL